MVQFLQETGKDEIKVRKNTVFCASEACFVLSCDPLEGSSHRLGTTDLHELTFAPITIVYLILYLRFLLLVHSFVVLLDGICTVISS